MSESFALHQFHGAYPDRLLLDVIVDTIDGISKRKVRDALMSGLITIDGSVVEDVHYKFDTSPKSIVIDLRNGSKTNKEEKIAKRPFQILHLDKDLIVVDKASGILASQPKQLNEQGFTGKHLADHIRRTLKKMDKEAPYLGYVHRLDLETSGCICLALTKDAHRKLAKQFQEKTAQRGYRCITTGLPKNDRDTLVGTITRGLDGRQKMMYGNDIEGEDAVTHFKVMERFEGGADVSVNLETGRNHQVRLAMASIGSPIFGDNLYGERKKKAPRLMLHAWNIEFVHPTTGQSMTFEAPMPKIFDVTRPPKLRSAPTYGQPREGQEDEGSYSSKEQPGSGGDDRSKSYSPRERSSRARSGDRPEPKPYHNDTNKKKRTPEEQEKIKALRAKNRTSGPRLHR
jgi:23S rRNA pseudouridine1911/1915/1917 synthase